MYLFGAESMLHKDLDLGHIKVVILGAMGVRKQL